MTDDPTRSPQQATPDEGLNPATRAAIARAREVNAAYLTELEAALLEEARRDVGPGQLERLARAEAFVEHLVGKRSGDRQQPMQVRYPGLPEIPFHDREDFPWLAAFEAAAGDIREELRVILSEDGDDLAPYINFPDHAPLDQWAELNRSPRWGAFHLVFDGRTVTWNARRAPKTIATLARLPQPWVPGRSPMAVFSVLQPKTRIPPHTGMANTRLMVHLPLIAPDGCSLRVGDQTRTWREGEAWVFDDSIEHEAWNDSDDVRAILICDVWNPRLSEDERRTITTIMATLDRFVRAAPGL